MTRKSKREIERQVDDLDPRVLEDVPQAGLCTWFMGWEVVDRDRRLIRNANGELRYVRPGLFEEDFLSGDADPVQPHDTEK